MWSRRQFLSAAVLAGVVAHHKPGHGGGGPKPTPSPTTTTPTPTPTTTTTTTPPISGAKFGGVFGGTF